MDPERALADLRALAATVDHAGPDVVRARLAESMAEVFAGLDSWLSRGGFAPHDWKRAVTVDGEPDVSDEESDYDHYGESGSNPEGSHVDPATGMLWGERVTAATVGYPRDRREP